MKATRRNVLLAAGSAAFVVPLGFSAPVSAEPTTAPECEPNPFTPKRQFRAMWIATVQRLDWPSPGDIETMKAEYLQCLEYAVAAKMNAVIVQVRPTADSFWPGALEPWSRYLSGTAGQDPGWDPLAFLLSEAHARNLEFHAWFNPYRISMPASATEAGVDLTKLPADHPVRNHPEWTVPYPVAAAGARLYYNPGIPAVREFVQNAVLDAVQKYDIDGVHFDDYFYPYPAAGQDFGDATTFAEHGAGWANKADWRRNNIDLLIKEMNEKIKAVKPWVKFGVSPFGIWRNVGSDPLGSETNGTQSYDANFADTRKWVKEQWIDYIVPQIYWHIGLAVADYAKLVPWWNDVMEGTRVHLYIGQANYKVALAGQPAAWFDPAEISKHLTFNQAYPNVDGDIHFRAKIVMADPIGSSTQFIADHYSRPALVPRMPHLPAGPMLFPVIVKDTRDASGVTLTIRHIWGDIKSYAIYRVDQDSEIGCDDARNLLGTVRRSGKETTFVDTTAEAGKRYLYVATALDRLWNESPPSPPRLSS
ncbi:glycoside hydrolase family 10 protein [Catelliglobosispora koreensis]|uniref:glycoside hydrolase family 10 protein n=1 Tax=Catelliglobosispora koreensis TaxID=129052 RepID=UPI00047691EC|nr:family 10 glycosylhydrolase [Catelliglobosispora koreensis]